MVDKYLLFAVKKGRNFTHTTWNKRYHYLINFQRKHSNLVKKITEMNRTKPSNREGEICVLSLTLIWKINQALHKRSLPHKWHLFNTSPLIFYTCVWSTSNNKQSKYGLRFSNFLLIKQPNHRFCWISFKSKRNILSENWQVWKFWNCEWIRVHVYIFSLYSNVHICELSKLSVCAGLRWHEWSINMPQSLPRRTGLW